MDPCFPEMEFNEPSEPDMSDPASTLPFDFIECSTSKSAAADVFAFHSEDLYSQLLNQRRRPDLDKYSSPSSSAEAAALQVPPHHLVMDRPKLKTRQKISKSSKKSLEAMYRSSASPQSAIPSAAVDINEKNRKIFYCRDCGKSFKFQTSLLRHNNKVHNCKYRCPTCHRVFSRQAYLDVHISKPGSSCFSNYLNVLKTRNIKT